MSNIAASPYAEASADPAQPYTPFTAVAVKRAQPFKLISPQALGGTPSGGLRVVELLRWFKDRLRQLRQSGTPQQVHDRGLSDWGILEADGSCIVSVQLPEVVQQRHQQQQQQQQWLPLLLDDGALL